VERGPHHRLLAPVVDGVAGDHAVANQHTGGCHERAALVELRRRQHLPDCLRRADQVARAAPDPNYGHCITAMLRQEEGERVACQPVHVADHGQRSRNGLDSLVDSHWTLLS
jgi:hypothetical protein